MIYFDNNKQAFAFEIPNYICTIEDDIWNNYAGTDKWDIIDGQFTDITDTEEYKKRQAQETREKLDALTLTPADVERALYIAKGMDFEDLKALIAEQIPTIDTKALAIEFRAKDFYRGAMAGGMRLFDVVGALLGYTFDDMDYLFQNKKLPNNKESEE